MASPQHFSNTAVGTLNIAIIVYNMPSAVNKVSHAIGTHTRTDRPEQSSWWRHQTVCTLSWVVHNRPMSYPKQAQPLHSQAGTTSSFACESIYIVHINLDIILLGCSGATPSPKKRKKKKGSERPRRREDGCCRLSFAISRT